MLKAGTKAPAFSVPDQNGTVHALSDYAGKWVFLFCYPKDDTPGCTTEAEGIRDIFSYLKRKKVVVLGVSPDTPAKHRKFIEKYNLPFPLLSDEDKRMLKRYKVWGKKKFMGREYDGVFRTSFLIAPDGKIAKIYEGVKPAEHAAEVRADVKALV